MVNLPPLTAAHALSAWRFQAAVVIPLIVVAAVYLWGVARVARRHPARPWPVFRTTLFLAGLVTIAVALLSFIGVYDDTLFWIHMIQHLMLIMVAPALLVAGRPLILTMHAARNPVHTIVKRMLRSRPVTVLTCPMVTIPLYAGTVVGTHLTSFMNVVITNPAAETGEILLYLIVGYLYFLPSVGDEPIRWRLSAPAKMVAVLLIMPIDTFTGLTLLTTAHEPWPAYAAQHRTWGPSPITDVHWGGAIMWVGGDVIMIVLILVSLFRWLFGTARSTKRLRWIERARTATFNQSGGAATRPSPGRDIDEDDAQLAAYNAWLAQFSSRADPAPPPDSVMK